MRILVIGAGAVGGYFGARLQAAGRDVTFLVRARRAEQLRRTGLDVRGPHGHWTLTPKLVFASELAALPPFDLILLSTKAYSLAEAIEDFAPAVGPETVILPLLNGMDHLDALAARFGEEHVFGGTSRIVADLDPEGRVLHLEPAHDLTFGPLDGQITPRVETVAATLHDAGFDDELSPDVLSVMWQKWVLLASMASITCLLRGTIGEVAGVPAGAETARALIRECAAIAEAAGRPAPPRLLQRITERLTDRTSTLTASMYRDLHKGNAVEADHILGGLLQRGEEHGVQAPLLRAAYAQLRVYLNRLEKR